MSCVYFTPISHTNNHVRSTTSLTPTILVLIDTIIPGQNFSVKHELRNGLYSFKLLNNGNLTSHVTHQNLHGPLH